MSDATVCGLPLEGGEEIRGVPVAALVVLKTFDEGSETGVCHRVLATGGLSVVEAYGMAGYGVLRLSEALRRHGEDDGDG